MTCLRCWKYKFQPSIKTSRKIKLCIKNDIFIIYIDYGPGKGRLFFESDSRSFKEWFERINDGGSSQFYPKGDRREKSLAWKSKKEYLPTSNIEISKSVIRFAEIQLKVNNYLLSKRSELLNKSINQTFFSIIKNLYRFFRCIFKIC